MDIERVIEFLDHPDQASAWFETLGVEDAERANTNLVEIARSGMTLDLLAVICGSVGAALAAHQRPDRALNNLEQFVAAARNPLSLGSLFERDQEALPTLLTDFFHQPVPVGLAGTRSGGV